MDKQQAIDGIYGAYEAAKRDKFLEGVERSRIRKQALRDGRRAEKDINYVQADGIVRARYNGGRRR